MPESEAIEGGGGGYINLLCTDGQEPHRQEATKMCVDCFVVLFQAFTVCHCKKDGTDDVRTSLSQGFKRYGGDRFRR